MNFWTGLHFFCSIVYVGAVLYVLVKNPYAVTNWILSMLFGCFALWSICSAILDNNTTSVAVADTVMKIQSIGWASFISFYMLFILFLTNNKKLLSMRIFIVSILLIPVVFIYLNFRGEMLVCCRPVSYGIAGTWKNAIWPLLFIAYYTAVFFLSVFLLFKYRNSVRSNSEKRVADILFGSTVAVFTIGTLFNEVMNHLAIYNPVDTNVVFLIFVFGYIYCAEKYETFTLSSTRNAGRIMELIDEGIVFLDRDERATTANRAAFAIFGYDGRYEIKDAYEFMEGQLKGATVEGAEITNYEFAFRDSQGADKTVLVSSRVLLNGKVNSGRVCSIRDITGKKKAEVDLVATVRELKRSNEELESFAYVASHDLKEPLRMVTSYVHLIRKRFMDKLGADGNDFINFATEGAARMSGLIEGILEYRRVGKTQKTIDPVDSAVVLDRVRNTLKFGILDKRAVITVSGTLPVIKADGTQIEQLFQNIIGNALKFSGSQPPVIEVSAEKNGNGYMFTFKDNGMGLDMKYGEKIFQMFQRLNRRDEFEGTGMGLAICAKIVESHGGRIWAKSEGPGKGCKFCFTIPENAD
jgi:PAS domain S-box-containing protein